MPSVVLFGSQQIAVDFLRYLTTQDDVEVALVVSSEAEHDALLGCESLLALAKRLNIRATAPLRGAEATDSLSNLKPDILFSVYYRKVLPPEVLRVPPLGCVNIHPGMLPNYRGPTPTAWAILNGANTFGLTLHYMDANIDTGDILVQEVHDIDPDETGYELHVRTMRIGAELLRRNFRAIVNGTLSPTKQEGPGSYFGKLKTGYTIDWQNRAEVIRNAVRVYASPYARVRTALHNKAVLVNHVTVLRNGHQYLLQGPGKIVDVLSGDALVVAAADGFLVLDEYELLPPMTETERTVLLRKGNRLG